MIYAFRGYQLNTQTYELHCCGDLCKIDARAFLVLRYLIENRDHAVSRDELHDNLWPNQTVSESIVANCIMTARRAIGDSGGEQEMIRTIYNAGYRFVAEVKEMKPAAMLGADDAFAQTPIFLDEAFDIHATADVSGLSSPQNVLGRDHLLVTVLCGALAPVEAQGENAKREASKSLRRFFFARVQELAKQHDGGFRFFGSNGFLIVFGWPRLREDHAQCAVRVGLELQERICNESRVLGFDAPLATSARMGLHTGPIELANRRDLYAVVPLAASETTRVAIRLHHLATPGIILTSPAILPLLRESVEYVEHGLMHIPRHSGSTSTYRLVRLAV